MSSGWLGSGCWVLRGWMVGRVVGFAQQTLMGDVSESQLNTMLSHPITPAQGSPILLQRALSLRCQSSAGSETWEILPLRPSPCTGSCLIAW